MIQSTRWQENCQGDNVLQLSKLRHTLSYPGWQEDYIHAEHGVLTETRDFQDVFLFKLEEKQRMHDGDRSNERLIRLDAHVFTYPGWQLDVQKLEEGHVLHKNGIFFDNALQGMINKENVYNGDRSHRNLTELDRLRKALSYPGWEQDFISAEQHHLIRPDDFQDSIIFMLVEKQRMHYGDRSHKRLRQLDSYAFNYPGWQVDKSIAEEEHVLHKKSLWFDRILQTMQNRQRMFTVMHRRYSVVASTLSDCSPPPPAKNDAPSNLKSDNCVICLSEPKTHAFIPCGHHCACKGCAFEAFGRSGMCPICRGDCDTVTKIFFS